jgi:hypothetical protein
MNAMNSWRTTRPQFGLEAILMNALFCVAIAVIN